MKQVSSVFFRCGGLNISLVWYHTSYSKFLRSLGVLTDFILRNERFDCMLTTLHRTSFSMRLLTWKTRVYKNHTGSNTRLMFMNRIKINLLPYRISFAGFTGVLGVNSLQALERLVKFAALQQEFRTLREPGQPQGQQDAGQRAHRQ